jgi:GTP cyclohydrolase I
MPNTDSIQIKIECQCGELVNIATHYIDSEGVVVYILAQHTCYKVAKEKEGA